MDKNNFKKNDLYNKIKILYLIKDYIVSLKRQYILKIRQIKGDKKRVFSILLKKNKKYIKKMKKLY